jgi:hypothetical protein
MAPNDKLSHRASARPAGAPRWGYYDCGKSCHFWTLPVPCIRRGLPPAPTTKLENTKQLAGAGRVERTVRQGFTRLMRFVPHLILRPCRLRLRRRFQSMRDELIPTSAHVWGSGMAATAVTSPLNQDFRLESWIFQRSLWTRSRLISILIMTFAQAGR